MQFDLTEEQTMIVSTVRRFVETELIPLEDEIETTGAARSGEGARDLREVALARLLRDEHSRRVRRRRPFGRRHDARRGAVRPHQGHPDPARVRQRLRIAARRDRCAEGALAAADGARRAHLLDRDHRARRRLGRGVDHHPGRAQRRRLSPQRQQALHQRRPLFRFLHRLGGDRSRRAAAPRVAVPRRQGPARCGRRPRPEDDGTDRYQPHRDVLRACEARPRAPARRRRTGTRPRLLDARPGAPRAGWRARRRQGVPPCEADDRLRERAQAVRQGDRRVPDDPGR